MRSFIVTASSLYDLERIWKHLMAAGLTPYSCGMNGLCVDAPMDIREDLNQLLSRFPHQMRILSLGATKGVVRRKSRRLEV